MHLRCLVDNDNVLIQLYVMGVSENWVLHSIHGRLIILLLIEHGDFAGLDSMFIHFPTHGILILQNKHQIPTISHSRYIPIISQF